MFHLGLRSPVSVKLLEINSFWFLNYITQKMYVLFALFLRSFVFSCYFFLSLFQLLIQFVAL